MDTKTYMSNLNNVMTLINKMRASGWTDEQIVNFAIVFYRIITHNPNNIP